jgi:hypothetical protein
MAVNVPPAVQAVLVDTDVYSYLMRGGKLADTYRPHVEGKLLAISFVTVTLFRSVQTEVAVGSNHKFDRAPQIRSHCSLRRGSV